MPQQSYHFYHLQSKSWANILILQQWCDYPGLAFKTTHTHTNTSKMGRRKPLEMKGLVWWLTRWVGFSDVDHQEVCSIAVVLDKFLELVKFEQKRGSGATPETQNERPVPCRDTDMLNTCRMQWVNTRGGARDVGPREKKPYMAPPRPSGEKSNVILHKTHFNII